VKAFEVAPFPSDPFIIVRLEIAETQVQIALAPEYAASLAADLADASKRMIRNGPKQ